MWTKSPNADHPADSPVGCRHRLPPPARVAPRAGPKRQQKRQAPQKPKATKPSQIARVAKKPEPPKPEVEAVKETEDVPNEPVAERNQPLLAENAAPDPDVEARCRRTDWEHGWTSRRRARRQDGRDSGGQGGLTGAKQTPS